MKDISARELKGHNILAVERFKDSTRWMIEFVVLHPCSVLTGAEVMKCVCFLQRTAIRTLSKIISAGKSKSSGMPVLLRDTFSTLSRERNAQENIEKVEHRNSLE